MTLRVGVYSRGQRRVHLDDCPACGYEFDRDEDRPVHLATYDPEDFGFSPIVEIPEAALAPLFGGEAGAD